MAIQATRVLDWGAEVGRGVTFSAIKESMLPLERELRPAVVEGDRRRTGWLPAGS